MPQIESWQMMEQINIISTMHIGKGSTNELSDDIENMTTTPVRKLNQSIGYKTNDSELIINKMNSIKLKFMKKTKLLRCALGVAVFAAFLAVVGLVGCEKVDNYLIKAPSDLQHRIDSIAAAKPNTGDTTKLIIATAIVGAENNSSAWWTAFTDRKSTRLNSSHANISY